MSSLAAGAAARWTFVAARATPPRTDAAAGALPLAAPSTAGNAANLLLFASLFGAVFFMAQFLQVAQGYEPLEAGLRMLPWTATLFLVAPVAGALVDRVGERPFVVGGLLMPTTHTLVRYRVAPDRAAENEALVRAVYEELARLRPPGLRYSTHVLEDGVTFVHQAIVDTPDGVNPLLELPAFSRFQEGIRERCEEPPQVPRLRAIGRYDGSDSTQSTNSGTSPQFSIATEPASASVSTGRSQAAS